MLNTILFVVLGLVVVLVVLNIKSIIAWVKNKLGGGDGSA